MKIFNFRGGKLNWLANLLNYRIVRSYPGRCENCKKETHSCTKLHLAGKDTICVEPKN